MLVLNKKIGMIFFYCGYAWDTETQDRVTTKKKFNATLHIFYLTIGK